MCVGLQRLEGQGLFKVCVPMELASVWTLIAAFPAAELTGQFTGTDHD